MWSARSKFRCLQYGRMQLKSKRCANARYRNMNNIFRCFSDEIEDPRGTVLVRNCPFVRFRTPASLTRHSVQVIHQARQEAARRTWSSHSRPISTTPTGYDLINVFKVTSLSWWHSNCILILAEKSEETKDDGQINAVLVEGRCHERQENSIPDGLLDGG